MLYGINSRCQCPYLAIIIFCLIFYATFQTYVPLFQQKDVSMGSYQIYYNYLMSTGPNNQTVTATHAPLIYPTSINYKIIAAMGYGTDYYIGSQTISISIEVSIIDISSVLVSFYTDYSQNWTGVWVWIMVIDILSPVYLYIMPSILRINNPVPPLGSITNTVSVLSFNSIPLTLGNLEIYSFIVGFVITSSTTDLEFGVSSSIIDASNIQVVVSYSTTLTNITNTRIDTVVIDKSLLFWIPNGQLDFQTIQCPTDPSYKIIFLQTSSDHQNMLAGLKRFYSISQPEFYLQLSLNTGSITILTNSGAALANVQYNFINFINLGCSGLYPYFDYIFNMCFDTYCHPIGFYRQLVPQLCSTCLYDCQTCINGWSCSSCITTNYRAYDPVTLRCLPTAGFYDDEMSNPVAQPCMAPCFQCTGMFTCTNCISTQYYVDITFYICMPCSNSMRACFTCASSTVCLQYCQYTCFTCTNAFTCSSCDLTTDKRAINPVTHYCDPKPGFYDDGTNNHVAQPCTSPCKGCLGLATYCTTCIATSFYLDSALHQCLPCSTALVGCLTCSISAGSVHCSVCNSALNFVITATFTCLCPINSFMDAMPSCIFCSSIMHRCQQCSDLITCSQCEPHFYFLTPIYCQQTCGDGLLFQLACDDGNLINGDGCDSTCHIQTYYTCSGGSSTTASVCQFNSQLDITIISYLKDQNKNSIYLDFSLHPILSLTNTQLSLMLSPNFPTTKIRINYNPLTGVCQFYIDYNKPLDTFPNKEISFQVSALKIFKISLSRPTDNNLALKVYSAGMYGKIQSLVDSSHILCYFFLTSFIIGWFSGQQLLASEMIFVLQYAYSGLLTQSQLDLSMKAFRQFYPLFGIVDSNHLSSVSTSFINSQLPIRLTALGFQASLIQNVNVSLILLMFIGFGSGIVYLIAVKTSMIELKQQMRKMLFLWTLNWMMLMQFPMMVSIWIMLSYQNPSQPNFVIDALSSCAYIILFLAMGVYLFVSIDKLAQTSKKIKAQKDLNQQDQLQKQGSNTKFTLTKKWNQYFKSVSSQQQDSFSMGQSLKILFYPVYMSYRMMLTIIFVFLGGTIFVHSITGLLNLVMFIYTCMARPYLNNISPIINSFMLVLMTTPYLYKQFNNDTEVDFFQFQGVVIIVGLLYVALLVNSYYILKDPIQKIYNFFNSLSNKNTQILPNNAKNDKCQPQSQDMLNESVSNMMQQQQYESSKVHKRKKRQKASVLQQRQNFSLKQNIQKGTQNTLIDINLNQSKQNSISISNNNNNHNKHNHNNFLNEQLKKNNFMENKPQKQSNQLPEQIQKTSQEFQKEKYIFEIEDAIQGVADISQLGNTITTIKQISSESHIFDNDFIDFQEGLQHLPKQPVKQKATRVRRKK